MEARSIYNKPKYDYEKELRNIEKMPTTPYNKAKIRAWHNHLSAKESGQYRICKVSAQIRRIIGAWHSLTEENRNLCEIDVESFEQVVGWINQRAGWSLATRADYRRCIKQFFAWYEEVDPRLQELSEIDITAEKEEQVIQWRSRQEAVKAQKTAKEFYKYIEKHVKRNYKTPQRDPSDVITDADLRLVITKGAKNSRDRALLGTLHEGGLRAAELLNLRLRDIQIEQDRALLHVNGKTGRRPVPIILNMAYLLRWIDDHPHKDSRDAYLWIGLSSRNKNQPLYHSAVSRLIDKAFTRAGVSKKHNMHWFRHSRASIYYGRMNDGELCDFFGWEKGSDMIKTYSHTRNDGAQAALNKIYNLSSRPEEEVLLTCGACGLHNTTNSKFCGRCGRPLSTEAYQSKEDYMQLAFQMMGKVMSDPALKEEYEEYCKKQQN